MAFSDLIASQTIEYYDSVAIYINTSSAFSSENYFITQAPFDIPVPAQSDPLLVYKAAGGLLSISNYTSNANFSIDKINITVAGIVEMNSSDVSANKPIMVKAQELEYIDKMVVITREYMDNHAIAYSLELFTGYIDAMNVTQDSSGDTTQVSIDVTSHWVDFDRVSTRYTNNTSQQEYFPNDEGFEYSVDIQKEVTWREPE